MVYRLSPLQLRGYSRIYRKSTLPSTAAAYAAMDRPLHATGHAQPARAAAHERTRARYTLYIFGVFVIACCVPE